MRRDPLLYLEDMLDATMWAQEFVEDLTFEAFLDDEKTKFAVLRCFTIIGEAVKRVPDAIRDAYPDVPWGQVVGMRNRIVHDYLDVDYGIVWQVIHEDLPVLALQLRRIIDAS